MKLNGKIITMIVGLEPVLFAIVVLLHLTPLLFNAYFLTFDGPSHLYNAKVISSILQEPDNLISTYYGFSLNPVPNLTGHFLLVFFVSVLPAWLAEKVVFILYVILLPYSFRYAIKEHSQKAIYLCYFIFPFVYSFTFYFGFLSYNLAIIVLLLLLGFLANNRLQKPSYKELTLISLGGLLLYFSHLFVFGIFILAVSSSLISRDQTFKKRIRSLYLFLLAMLPSMLLVGWYVHNNVILNTGNKHGANRMLSNLLDAAPAKGILYGSEGNITRWIPILIILIVLIGAITEYKSRARNPKKILLKALLPAGMLILYFTLSDELVGGGLISIRVLHLFFFFLLIWLSFFNIPKWLKVTSLATCLYISFALLVIYSNHSKSTHPALVAMEKAAILIEPNSTVLTLSGTIDRTYIGLSSYLGTSQNCVLLVNYETTLPYFPTYWKVNQIPEIDISDIYEQPAFAVPQGQLQQTAKPDYIFWQGREKCRLDTNIYTQVFSAENLTLFRNTQP